MYIERDSYAMGGVRAVHRRMSVEMSRGNRIRTFKRRRFGATGFTPAFLAQAVLAHHSYGATGLYTLYNTRSVILNVS